MSRYAGGIADPANEERTGLESGQRGVRIRRNECQCLESAAALRPRTGDLRPSPGIESDKRRPIERGQPAEGVHGVDEVNRCAGGREGGEGPGVGAHFVTAEQRVWRTEDPPERGIAGWLF